jgi:PleD family two-component response regulator
VAPRHPAAAAVDVGGSDTAAFTVSIGVARLQAGDLRGSITRADAALYRAKQHGRNQVMVDDGGTPI